MKDNVDYNFLIVYFVRLNWEKIQVMTDREFKHPNNYVMVGEELFLVIPKPLEIEVEKMDKIFRQRQDIFEDFKFSMIWSPI